jgi:glycosyltransferase involved in cell wall biosynthesis
VGGPWRAGRGQAGSDYSPSRLDLEGRQLKVAIVTRYPKDPDSPSGGIEALSVNLVRGLAQLEGLTTTVVTTDAAVASPVVEVVEGIEVHRLPRTARHVLVEAVGPGRRQMLRYLTRLAPDVVHSHDVYGLMVKGLPLPRAFTLNGFIHADTRLSDERFATIRSLLWRWFETEGWADQPHLISVSPYVRERLSSKVKGVIHDIENPISEAFFGVERREQPRTIFSAALVEPRKNTIALVEALALLVARGIDARLRIAGRVTHAEYGARLEERIGALGLGDRVVVLGACPTPRVREELAAASVFALVSLEETAPVAIEEAMAAGVPVVTSNRCGMPYMVREGESGFLVEPGDIEEIADRLGRVLGDAALGSRMSARSRSIALDRFHPLPIARRTRDVYARACANRGRRAA